MQRLPKNKPSTISCPNCLEMSRGDVKLIVRTNKENGTQFLGCPNYPACDFTQPIREETRMRLQGQKELF